MKLSIFIEKTNKKLALEVKEGILIEEVLNQLGINKTTVLTAVNKGLVPEDTKIKKGDSLEILSVISGG